jgi:Histidine kinase
MPGTTHPDDAAHNTFQRMYFRWARPYYARMPPQVRAQAEAIDRVLYSRRGLGLWVGFLASLVVAAWGLRTVGVPWLVAVPVAVVLVVGLIVMALSAWLTPERYSGRKLWRGALLMMLGTYAGTLATVITRGSMDGESPQRWLETAGTVIWRATPFQLIAGLALVLIMWVTTTARREVLQRDLARSRLEAERDSAARQASEAQLRLLHAQIQPHFLFNTLAALQHWVDGGDPRAGALLRSLTAFLRGSTELLAQPAITLAQEGEMLRHYLTIMQARLGERLRFTIHIADDCAALTIPPGLLVTLAENAVEHGIGPQLRGGLVEVRVARAGDAVELCVRDDGAGLAAGWHEGVGITNSRERVRHQFGAAASLQLGPREDGPGAAARVVLPHAPAPDGL